MNKPGIHEVTHPRTGERLKAEYEDVVVEDHKGREFKAYHVIAVYKLDWTQLPYPEIEYGPLEGSEEEMEVFEAEQNAKPLTFNDLSDMEEQIAADLNPEGWQDDDGEF